MRYLFTFCIMLFSSYLSAQMKFPMTTNEEIKSASSILGAFSIQSVERKNILLSRSDKYLDFSSSSPMDENTGSLEEFSYFGSAGGGYAKVFGPYYEEFNPAATLRLGISWFVDAPWFIEFYYGNTSFDGNQITRLVDYTMMDRTCSKLSFNEFGLGVGRTISLFSGNLRLYGLLGLTWVAQTQNLTFTVNKAFPNVGLRNYSSVEKLDVGGYKLEAGFIIPIVNRIYTLLSFSVQGHEVQRYSSNLIAVYSDGTSSPVNDENNGVFNFTFGIVYPF